MKIYVTTRIVEEFDLDEDDLLAFLKKSFNLDEEIQSAKTLEDIADVDEVIMEAGDYLTESKISRKIKNGHVMSYTNYDEAYEDMEWGIH